MVEESQDDTQSAHVDVEDALWQQSPFGVALSGGGVRASLFSLGALVFLVDSGLNRRVSEISSVSGGSITNAAVAQRCDFSTVTRDEFDEHAKHLASATVRGLVPKAPVVTGYGLLTALVVGIVVWSWPFGLPWWADLAFIGGLGFAILLRGLLLAWLLRQHVFRAPDRTLASLRNRRVNHVFCTTDLNSSGPTYLMSRAPHILSSAWGKPLGIQKSAGGLPVATAVRASAAFPGGLPPVRLRTADFDLHQSAAQQYARYREMDFAEMGGPTPKAIYLSDGGVWNNIGTDWFLEHRRSETPLSVDWNGVEADRFVVVDASAPNVSEPRLWYLTFPWLAELGSVVRTLKAMSASTVSARIDAFDSELEKQGAHPTGCLAVVRLLRRVPESTAGPSPWPAPWWHERRRIFQRKDPDTIEVDRWFLKHSSHLFRVNARVPTTLFAVRAGTAFDLLLHGYCATRQALIGAGLVCGADCPVPTLDRFSALVGLGATNSHGVWWVGRGEPSMAAILLAPIGDTIGESIRQTVEFGAATNISNVLIDEVKKRIEELQQASEKHAIAAELHHNAWKALSAYIEGDFDRACELYDECDRSGTLDALQLVFYANALGRCAPGTGLKVVRRAEQQARETQPDLLLALYFGWALSTGYALNGGADSAVAWLRRIEGTAGEPAFSEQFLTASELDGIRGAPAFRNYLDELASRSTND